MCTICSQFYAYQPDCAYREQADSDISQAAGNGAARGGQAALPVFTLDQIAFQLTDAFWTNQGDIRAGFNTSVGGTITVDITALTGAGQQLARWALDAWSAVSGLLFSEVGSGAQITFDDEASGAYANSSLSGGYLTSSFVNVSKYNWLPSYGTTIDSYSFQTYIHEIGHALGLGHAGHYNGAASYSQAGGGSNHYLNDSWQATVMSYFDQVENTFITASYAYAVTAMAADILAMSDLYGTAAANTGDTTYGANSNIGGYLGDLFAQFFGDAPANPAFYGGGPVAITLYDTSGTDTLDLSPDDTSQHIDLAPEAVSDVLGLIGNLIIARGTVIENVIGGSGADTILGNAAYNVLKGGEGQDSLRGGGAADTLVGGADDDTLHGGDGDDRLQAEAGDDQLYGNIGSDRMLGEIGSDRLSGGDGMDTLLGGNGEDLLLGGADADRLRGGAGEDVLKGGDGNDVLFGEDGADTIRGEDGDDRLKGGGGTDQLFGDAGSDTLEGGADNDRLSGGDATDVLDGDSGSDLLLGGADDDRLFGGDGSDVLRGGSEDDLLFGNAGDDILRGESGADTLSGDAGNDKLIGDSGIDGFIFADGFGNDRVMDFDAVALETIDLAAVTAITDYANLTNPLAGHLYQSGANVVIDDLAGNTILLLGVDIADLTADHFLF